MITRMFLNFFLIVSGVVVALVVGLFIFVQYLSFKAKGRRKAWLATHQPAPLTPERKRVLTFGAILAHYRGENALNMAFEGEKNFYTEGLAGQWEISNRSEALETIGQLLVLERSTEFDAWIASNSEPERLEAVHAAVAEALGIAPEVVRQVRTTYAWDCCRMVCLAKWCYWLDYITEDEMWAFAEQAVAKASAGGKDWQEYTIAFLIGRAIHGFGLDIAEDCKRLLKAEDKDTLYKQYAFR